MIYVVIYRQHRLFSLGQENGVLKRKSFEWSFWSMTVATTAGRGTANHEAFIKLRPDRAQIFEKTAEPKKK